MSNRMETSDMQDIPVHNEGEANSSMNSLAAALASAAATEHDHRRRKILVQNMVRVLFQKLEPIADGTSPLEWTRAQSDHLSQQILGQEETGGTTIAGSFSAVTPTTKIIVNGNNPLKLLWSWQISQGSDGVTEYSTCYLSMFAKEGVTIDFFPPTQTQTAQENLKIATCDVSNFQWTLEGTTKKRDNGDENLQDIQTFWKLESTSFSWISGSMGDIPAEETLLEGRDISLTGKIMQDQNGAVYQLQPKSVLSLSISSVGSLGLSDKEIRRVGMALRALVNFLDEIVRVPELHLLLTDVSDHTQLANEVAKPPPGDDGEIMSLGGAMKYYLKHYCNDANKHQTGKPTAKLLSSSIGAVSAAMKDSAAKSRTNIAESKERYAAAAGEAVEAATTAGKKIAGSFWGSVGSLTAGLKQQQQQQQESGETNAEPTNNNSNNNNNSGFRFGDNFRKAVARGKEATGRIVAEGNRQSEGFRIGGFSRGLFASAQASSTERSSPTQPEQPSQEEQQT